MKGTIFGSDNRFTVFAIHRIRALEHFSNARYYIKNARYYIRVQEEFISQYAGA
jgi:hypothetical protein